MNAVPPPLSHRWLVLALCCLPLLAVPAFAAESVHAATLQASFLMEIIGDRSRMIQVSLVFVVFGCALLWWRK